MNEEINREKNEEENFATLFEKTEVRKDFLNPGHKIEATVVKITKDWLFIDLGGKS
jgi:small subunit ribosomal protein S1